MKKQLLRSARSLKQKTDTKNITFGASICLVTIIAALLIVPQEYLTLSFEKRIGIGSILIGPCLIFHSRYQKHAKLRKV